MPDVEKSWGTRNIIADVCWKNEKAKEYHEQVNTCFIDYTKYLIVSIMSSCDMSLGKMGIGKDLIVLMQREEAVVQTKLCEQKLALS